MKPKKNGTTKFRNCEICETKNSGQMKQLKHETDQSSYSSSTWLQCNNCGTKWLMTREDSYHQPSVNWTRIAEE